MIINSIQIDDTFAEAFNMRGTRVIITAQNLKWAYHAAHAMTGFATSVIGCGVEAGIEAEISSELSPDGRHVAFTALYNAYVAPSPDHGGSIELSKDTQAVPVTALSTSAGVPACAASVADASAAKSWLRDAPRMPSASHVVSIR